MPRIPINPPDDFFELKPFFDKIEDEMRKAENSPVELNLCENYWKIFQLHHQRSRYVFELLKRNKLSRSLYEYLKINGYVDHSLICYWKKQGYEHLCCLRCVQPLDNKYGNVCICRVPQRSLEVEDDIKCDNCGCRGCSGY